MQPFMLLDNEIDCVANVIFSHDVCGRIKEGFCWLPDTFVYHTGRQ